MASTTAVQTHAAHRWVAATNIYLDDSQAHHGQLRGALTLREDDRVDILLITCDACKRPYTQVYDQPCSAVESTEHVRGGPIGERKKRGPRRPKDEPSTGPDIAATG